MWGVSYMVMVSVSKVGLVSLMFLLKVGIPL